MLSILACWMWVADAGRIPMTIAMSGHSTQSGWPGFQILWYVQIRASHRVIPLLSRVEGIAAHEGSARLFALMQPKEGWTRETKNKGALSELRLLSTHLAQYTSCSVHMWMPETQHARLSVLQSRQQHTVSTSEHGEKDAARRSAQV